MSEFLTLPGDLPAAHDDSACAHLSGFVLPSVELPGTDGHIHDLSALPGRSVLYVYPRMARPGVPMPGNWDLIPGAWGCTPQSCAFRDHHGELRTAGARVFGLSVQSTAEQQEAATRLHLPFPLLSDAGRGFSHALRLPTFEAGGQMLLRRVTLILNGSAVEHVFYPVRRTATRPRC